MTDKERLSATGASGTSGKLKRGRSGHSVKKGSPEKVSKMKSMRKHVSMGTIFHKQKSSSG